MIEGQATTGIVSYEMERDLKDTDNDMAEVLKELALIRSVSDVQGEDGESGQGLQTHETSPVQGTEGKVPVGTGEESSAHQSHVCAVCEARFECYAPRQEAKKEKEIIKSLYWAPCDCHQQIEGPSGNLKLTFICEALYCMEQYENDMYESEDDDVQNVFDGVDFK